MPAGLTVFNDTGQYVIDETTFCWVVIAQGDINAGTTVADPFGVSTNNLVVKRINLAAPADTVFAVYIPRGISSAEGGILNMSYSGGTWTVDIVVANDDTQGALDISGGSYKWFALGRPPAAPAGANYGLEVYDAGGGLRFSSHWRTRAPVTPTGDASRRYAFLGGSIEYEHDVDVEILTTNQYQTTTIWWIYAYWCSGGNVNGGRFPGSGSGPGGSRFYSEVSGGAGGGGFNSITGISQPLIAIDVTDLT